MSRPPTLFPLPSAATETRVRALLAQEKWRQARDELKLLVKADRARFLPFLVEANIGLARKMLAGGQASEARQVLTYLATIAPAEQLRALELEFALKSGASETSLSTLIAALADSVGALADAGRFQPLADAVVLSFSPAVACDPARPAEARLMGEMSAVHDALRAVSEARWKDVPESLRRVPHRSVFSHWAVFVKGVAAFHAGENERAVKLWRSLPPTSLPAKASQPYLHLAGDPAGTDRPMTEAVVDGICRIAGMTGTSGILLRAEQLWRKEKPAESYRVVRDGIASFPSLALDLAGALTEFYFKAPNAMAEKSWSNLLQFFGDLIDRGRFKNRIEQMMAYRTLALMGATRAPAEEFRRAWESFLREHQAIHGENSRLASLGYGWLGEQLSKAERSVGFFEARPRMRDSQGAVAALRKSIELDPSNLTAHLRLGAVYHALKKNSERNRLLDLMTARFPDDHRVLVAAARGCLERKAFNKGLDYLVRARNHDQLDPQIPEMTVIALQALAREQFQRYHLEKARQTLARAEEWLVDKADDFERSRWSAGARYSAMEGLWGDAAQAKALIAQARQHAPNPIAALLLGHLAHRSYAKSRLCESPFFIELKEALRAEPRLAEMGLLIRLVKHWRATGTGVQTHHEQRLLGDALKTAADRPFTRAEAAEVIERASDNPDYGSHIRLIAGKILRDDPRDPQFRLWRFRFTAVRSSSPAEARAEIQSIVEEASRRRDENALRQARQILRDLEQQGLSNPLEPDFEDADADDDDDDEIENETAPELPPKAREKLSEIIEILRTASPREILKIQKNMRDEIPPEFFEKLVEFAKNGFPPSLSPLEPEAGKPKEPPRDENQYDLF